MRALAMFGRQTIKHVDYRYSYAGTFNTMKYNLRNAFIGICLLGIISHVRTDKEEDSAVEYNGLQHKLPIGMNSKTTLASNYTRTAVNQLEMWQDETGTHRPLTKSWGGLKS